MLTFLSFALVTLYSADLFILMVEHSTELSSDSHKVVRNGPEPRTKNVLQQTLSKVYQSS